MCNRFTQKADPHEFTDHLRLATIEVDLSDTRDRYPLYDVAAVRLDERGQRLLAAYQWGLLPRWWKPSERSKSRKSFQRQTYNARSETVDIKPAYREAFRRRRVLVPASQFYEHGFYFRLAGQPLFAFAGLADHWEGDSESINSCTILTTEANDMVGKVHPRKRMPVILDGDEAYRQWLDQSLNTREQLEHLFEPFPDAAMEQIPADD